MIKLKDNVVFKGLSTDTKINDVRISFFLTAIKHTYGSLGNQQEIVDRIKKHFDVTITIGRLNSYFANKNAEKDAEALHENLGYYSKPVRYKQF